MPEVKDKEWPVKGRVYYRESTKEWVLELTYEINNTYGVSRHPCPANMKPEDVPGLDWLYDRLEDLETQAGL